MDKIENKFVTIYNRFLKTPIFRAQSKENERRITQKFKNGGEMIVETSADKLPDSSDFEKYMIIMYAIETKRIKRFVRGEESIYVEVPLAVFRELNRNNYESIVKSVSSIASVTIKYKGEKVINGKKKDISMITHIIHHAEIIENNTLKVSLNKVFYDIVYNKHKTLRVHLQDYLKLQGHAKNVYAILVGNGSKEEMNLKTIADRALIEEKRERDTIRIVKNALKTINDITEIFKDRIEIIKDKVKIIRRKKRQKKVQKEA
jgi:hypothetical protein